MKRYLTKLTKKSGLPPGTAIHIGSKKTEPAFIIQTNFTKTTQECQNITDLKTLKDPDQKNQIHWIDIRGIHNVKTIKSIGETFNLHGLMLEDILNTTQLPKIEEFPTHFFLVIKFINFEDDKLSLEHICLYFKPGVVLSFQEKISDTFKVVRDRILEKSGKVTEKEADYLVYALFDYVIDTYFETLRNIDLRISELNDEVDTTPSHQTLKKIQSLKNQILVLKRHFWYTRDIIYALKKSDSKLISPKTDKYLGDLQDHVAHIIDISESFREELIDLIERHLSAISLRTNNIMKLLTIVAAIFMPLTFLAGIYGMNFKVMPELEWPWSYPILISVMILLAAGLLVFFKRRQWLEMD